jgi:hypothetical protein
MGLLMLAVPAPVLTDASLSPDRSTLHLAWDDYENPSPVDIDGVPTQVNCMLGGVAAYDANGNGVSVTGGFGLPQTVNEMTIPAPALGGVQRLIMAVLFYDATGVNLVGQSPVSNSITIDFGAATLSTSATAPKKVHGKH